MLLLLGIGSEIVVDPPKVQPNTKVYVNHLPLDITEEEIGKLHFYVIAYYFAHCRTW